MSDTEVPEPDAAEQSLLVAETADFVEVSDDPEVPEADAIEQAMERLDLEDDGVR